MFHHRSNDEKGHKPHSRRNKSKGRIDGGRTSIKKVNTGALSRQDRLNTLKQLRQAKRDEILERRRLGADEDGPPPPMIVAMVAFHSQADALSLKRRILGICEVEGASAVAPHVPATTILPAWARPGPSGGRPRVLLVDAPRNAQAVMDVAKCADVVLCVLGPHASLEEPAFDALGYRFLTMLKSQGLPSVIGTIHGDVAMTSAKKVAEARKFVTRYFASELGSETKLVSAGTDEEIKVLMRAIGALVPKDITWRSDRGYLLSQEAQHCEGTLCLRGYVRGPGFRCKHPVHLTGHGDFVLARIARLPDPCPLGRNEGTSERVVDELSGELDLARLQPYDPTTEEQTWPTAEELAAGRGRGTIPAPSSATTTSADGATSADGEAEADMEQDDGEGAEEGEDAGGSDSEAAPSIAPTAGTEEAWDVSSNMTMELPSSEVVAAERRRREVLYERSREEMDFPDEVDTPLEVPARERFQKYRGLKSFRTSPWDPYEELPVEYSRIWEFESFTSTARALRQQFVEDCYDLEDGGVSTYYCALYLKGVPASVVESQPSGVPFVLSTMLPMEQKVSVVHSTISRVTEYTEAVKSKQEISLHCGFRRLTVRPVFSEPPKKSSTCKKFKFSRFLHEGVTACASFYAPVIFPPCRMLAFAGEELVGTGAITGCNPKQLIIKRSVLTGYPFKTHKGRGVVRFMFFNPADVKWFKPVELSTRRGLRGHITESLGTHGYMKCRFSAGIKQDDTVCMNLYKRVYPKWYPPSWGGREEDGPETA